MHIKDEVKNTIVIEKSRFIAFSKAIFSEDDYKEYIKTLRKQYYDASHVCSALICGNIKRSSDDGEPSGTAGVPILNVLEKKQLDNTCIIVIRYFGGIKLGAGGLIRAYSNAASSVIENGIIVEEVEYKLYKLEVNYETANRLDNVLNKNTLYLIKDYDEHVNISFVLKDDKVLDKIIEITRGIKPINIGNKLVEKVVK